MNVKLLNIFIRDVFWGSVFSLHMAQIEGVQKLWRVGQEFEAWHNKEMI